VVLDPISLQPLSGELQGGGGQVQMGVQMGGPLGALHSLPVLQGRHSAPSPGPHDGGQPPGGPGGWPPGAGLSLYPLGLSLGGGGAQHAGMGVGAPHHHAQQHMGHMGMDSLEGGPPASLLPALALLAEGQARAVHHHQHMAGGAGGDELGHGGGGSNAAGGGHIAGRFSVPSLMAEVGGVLGFGFLGL
jgi:hypothetical protein